MPRIKVVATRLRGDYDTARIDPSEFLSNITDDHYAELQDGDVLVAFLPPGAAGATTIQILHTADHQGRRASDVSNSSIPIGLGEIIMMGPFTYDGWASVGIGTEGWLLFQSVAGNAELRWSIIRGM